jgi:hypothetical protein
MLLLAKHCDGSARATQWLGRRAPLLVLSKQPIDNAASGGDIAARRV